MAEALSEEIYREYYGKVLGYLSSRISSRTDAEDLAADVFLKVLQNLDDFDPEKASVSTWIYTITRNTLTDYFRTRKQYEQLPEDLSEDSVEEDVCSAQQLEALADALEALDKRERDVIILRFYSGKTLKEISGQMGLSYAYIKVLQNSAYKKIRAFLEN